MTLTPRPVPGNLAGMAPRSEQVDLSVTPFYHCMARCVRRAFLCGQDELTGKDFSHRKGWIRDRIVHLASVFSIDVCAYAVMSNHLHVVLHADRDRAEGWSEEEVMERHGRLFPGAELQVAVPARQRKARVALWRARLHDISWFMRCLNESIARMANAEDEVQGRFWEGRFKSQALVDERGLLACMVYVDLNPMRAGIAGRVEESEFTSLRDRVAYHLKMREQHRARRAPKGMAEFHGERSRARGEPRCTLPIGFDEYLALVTWTGKVAVHGKTLRGRDRPSMFVSASSAAGWITAQQSRGIASATALGELSAVQSLASSRAKRSLRGIGIAHELTAA